MKRVNPSSIYLTTLVATTLASQLIIATAINSNNAIELEDGSNSSRSRAGGNHDQLKDETSPPGNLRLNHKKDLMIECTFTEANSDSLLHHHEDKLGDVVHTITEKLCMTDSGEVYKLHGFDDHFSFANGLPPDLKSGHTRLIVPFDALGDDLSLHIDTTNVSAVQIVNRHFQRTPTKPTTNTGLGIQEKQSVYTKKGKHTSLSRENSPVGMHKALTLLECIALNNNNPFKQEYEFVVNKIALPYGCQFYANPNFPNNRQGILWNDANPEESFENRYRVPNEYCSNPQDWCYSSYSAMMVWSSYATRRTNLYAQHECSPLNYIAPGRSGYFIMNEKTLPFGCQFLATPGSFQEYNRIVWNTANADENFVNRHNIPNEHCQSQSHWCYDSFSVMKVRSLGTSLIDSKIEEIRNHYNAVGLTTFTVNEKNQICNLGAAGKLIYGDPRKPFVTKGGTRLHVGSVTKSMTATLIAIAIKEDKIESWDTTLGGLLDFAKNTPFSSVSLRDVAAMRSGLQRDPTSGWWSFHDGTTDTNLRGSREKVAHYAMKSSPVTTPGSTWEYSNLGYVILGHILEYVYDNTWENILKSKIFDPLGVDLGTSFTGAPTGANDPLGHFGNPPSPCYPNTNGGTCDNPPVLGPAGTFSGPAESLAAYLSWHVACHNGLNENILSQSECQVLHTPVDSTSGYGYGWWCYKRSWAGPGDFDACTHSGSNLKNQMHVWLGLGENVKKAFVSYTNQIDSHEMLDKAVWETIISPMRCDAENSWK